MSNCWPPPASTGCRCARDRGLYWYAGVRDRRWFRNSPPSPTSCERPWQARPPGNPPRSICCGTLGYPVYKTLHESGSRKVLQVSHLGGHRYAPVLLALPEWRFFGHLDCDSCLTMDRVLGQGEPYLEGYRGSGRLPAELQPIEARLWEEYGNQLKELRLANGHGTSTLTVSASFQDGTRRSYRARLGVQEQRGFKSCSDMPKGKQKAIELPTLESLLETVE
jgi:hypothetical protein